MAVQKAQQSSSESGSVMFETILCVPILLVFTMAIVDLGSWFNQHYAVSRVVYEGSRAAAGLADLKAITPSASNGNEPCLTINYADLSDTSLPIHTEHSKGHWVVVSRMQTILDRQYGVARNLNNQESTFKSCYDSSSRRVWTEIEVPFESIMAQTFNINGWMYDTDIWPSVSAQATAPYLLMN